MATKIIVVIIILSLLPFYFLYQEYKNQVENIEDFLTCEVVSDTGIKRLMGKVGPYYHYRIYPSGRIEVKINDNWLYLDKDKILGK